MLPPAQQSIFVGRSAELSTLRWATDRALVSERQLLLITGEPGVGKTHLAVRLSQEAADRGFAVYVARCWQWGGAPAMWPWIQVLRELAPAERRRGNAELAQRCETLLARLSSPEGAGQSAGQESRFALFDDVAELLARATEAQAVLVHIDDLHAADPSSVDLLRFFARDARAARLLVVATVRDVEADASDEVSAFVDDLYRDCTVLRLRGLSSDELRELVEQIGQTPLDATILQAVQHCTNGNPLFVDGLVRAALAEGGLARMLTGDYTIPPSIRGAIDRRLERYDSEDRRCLHALAVLGRDATTALIALATKCEAAEVATVFARATTEGLLVETPPGSGRFGFGHALVADALYRELAPFARSELHLAIARTLDDMVGDELAHNAAELARHYLSAGTGEPLLRGIELAITAGDRAKQVFAYEESAGFYERALEAMDLAECTAREHKGRVLLELADSLLLSGRPESARAPLRRLAQLHPDDELFAQAALLMARTGEFAVANREAITLLEEAEQRLEQQKGPLRAHVLSCLATAVWTDQSAAERRRELASVAIRLAEESGDMKALAVALAARMSAFSGPANLEERLQWGERLLAAANACGDLLLIFEAHRWRLTAHWEAGDRVNADATLDEYSRLAEELRWPQARMNAAMRRAVLCEMLGDLRLITSEIEKLEEFGNLARDPQTDYYLVVGRFCVLRERGDVDALRADLPTARAAIQTWRELPAAVGALLEYLRAAGLREEARALYESHAADGFRSVSMGFGTTAAYAMYADACVDFEDRARASQLRDLMLPFRDQNTAAGLSTCKGAVARYIGRLELLLGNLDSAIDYFERAMRINRRIGARGFLAYTMRDFAEALRQRARADDLLRAQSLHDDAVRLAEELGFVALLQELRNGTGPGGLRPHAETPEAVDGDQLVRRGEIWLLRFDDRSVQFKDSRGMRYLFRLVQQQGQEIHALELSAGEHGREGESIDAGDGGPIFDLQARVHYQSRVEELRDLLAEAERHHDHGRAERARAELDAIARHLAEGLGLGGRTRRTGGAAERARVAVSRALKRTIDKIGREHPEAGAHFESALKTGTYCCYAPSPAQRRSWLLSAD